MHSDESVRRRHCEAALKLHNEGVLLTKFCVDRRSYWWVDSAGRLALPMLPSESARFATIWKPNWRTWLAGVYLQGAETYKQGELDLWENGG